MINPNTPTTIIVLGASLLLLIASISTPILRSIYFLSVELTPSSSISTSVNRNLSDLNAVLTLGVFGFCLRLGSQVTCSSPQLGYTVDPASMISLPPNINFDFSNWFIKTLAYPLILHPIASGMGFLSFISGVISHFSKFSRSRFTTWLSSIASAFAFGSFSFDIIIFSLAKSRINSVTNTNFSINAQLGNAIWITLAGWISLALSGCLFCAARCILSRRQRGQSRAHLLRPELDQDYNYKMREQAEKAEQAREKSSISHSHLPAFAEYAPQEDRHQEQIPLNSFPPEDEAYTPHSERPEFPEVETLVGVGAGYGRRQRQPSVMSQDAVHSHPSQSRPSPVQPIRQPTQSYSYQFSSPLSSDQLSSPPNHNPTSSDLYRSITAHVSHASNLMNQPPRSNSMDQSLQANSLPYRLPQSLIPAGGVMAYESNRTGLPRDAYSSPPSSHTSVIPPSQMYHLSPTLDFSSQPPSSQPTMSALAYLQPQTQPNSTEEPPLKNSNHRQHYTLQDPTAKQTTGHLPPPVYQPQFNQVESTSNNFHPPGLPEAFNEEAVNCCNAPSEAAQQSSRYNDPFTYTYDLAPQARQAHHTEGIEAGLAYDQMNNSSRLISSQGERYECDQQSRGDTDYTLASFVASSAEQPAIENQTFRRELPQVPSLPPLPFIPPHTSPLHPRNKFDFPAHETR